jgi:hypothetical protein
MTVWGLIELLRMIFLIIYAVFCFQGSVLRVDSEGNNVLDEDGYAIVDEE